jgi:hypothetical protein
MSTLRELLEQEQSSYSVSWAIWAYVDPQRGLRPEAPARIGNTLGGVDDGLTMIVNGATLGEMIHDFSVDYESDALNERCTWRSFYLGTVVDILIEDFNNRVSYEMEKRADFERALANAKRHANNKGS